MVTLRNIIRQLKNGGELSETAVFTDQGDSQISIQVIDEIQVGVPKNVIEEIQTNALAYLDQVKIDGDQILENDMTNSQAPGVDASTRLQEEINAESKQEIGRPADPSKQLEFFALGGDNPTLTEAVAHASTLETQPE